MYRLPRSGGAQDDQFDQDVQPPRRAEGRPCRHSRDRRLAADLHPRRLRPGILQRADRRHRHHRLQHAADRRLCRRGRRRAEGLRARRRAPQRRRRRRPDPAPQAVRAQGQRHPRQEGRGRHRRRPDQGRRRPRLGPPHDRARRRRDDHRRLVVRRGDRRAGPLPGEGRHLHGGPHPLQRHHRQGQEALRLPPLLQRLPVGHRARPGARRGLRQGPHRLPPDRRLHLGLDPGRVDQERHRSARLEDPRRRSARRSAPATSASTSRRCSTRAPTC